MLDDHDPIRLKSLVQWLNVQIIQKMQNVLMQFFYIFVKKLDMQDMAAAILSKMK